MEENAITACDATPRHIRDTSVMPTRLTGLPSCVLTQTGVRARLATAME